MGCDGPPNKPYRPNVGIALFNRAGRVLIARRFKDDGPEVIYPGLEWQMPQGGIDRTKTRARPRCASCYEETGVTCVDYLGETPDWMTYEFPPYDGPPHRLSVFRGQRQKWFAFRFTGAEREIAVLEVRNGQPVEFDAWRWEPLAQRARTWWCRSGARFTRRWRGNSRGLPDSSAQCRSGITAPLTLLIESAWPQPKGVASPDTSR